MPPAKKGKLRKYITREQVTIAILIEIPVDYEWKQNNNR